MYWVSVGPILTSLIATSTPKSLRVFLMISTFLPMSPDSALVAVEVPVEGYVEWLIDTDSDGGALDSDIGQLIAVDTVGGASVNAGDSAGMRVDMNDITFPTILVTGRLSATQIIGVIAKRADVLIPDTGTIT